MISLAAVDRCLHNAGVRRAGDIRELAKGRIAVPVVGYMSRCELPDYVLEPDGKEWRWCKPRDEERHENSDPLSVRR